MSEDKVLKKLVEMDNKISHIEENMVIKSEYLADHGDIIQTLQHIVVTVDRLDSERLAVRHELDRHDKDIKVLKKHLSIS